MEKEEAKRFEHSRIRYKGKEYSVQQVTDRVIICQAIDSSDRLELAIENVNLFEITHLPIITS